MPIYEFRCNRCGHTFSRLQKINTDTSKMSCPECDHETVERLLSTFASTGSRSDGAGASCAPSSGFS